MKQLKMILTEKITSTQAVFWQDGNKGRVRKVMTGSGLTVAQIRCEPHERILSPILLRVMRAVIDQLYSKDH
jgi:hypothetical protein